jgi:hypothetical protein
LPLWQQVSQLEANATGLRPREMGRIRDVRH